MRHRDTLGRLFRTAIVWSAILTASLAAQQQSSPGPTSQTPESTLELTHKNRAQFPGKEHSGVREFNVYQELDFLSLNQVESERCFHLTTN